MCAVSALPWRLTAILSKGKSFHELKMFFLNVFSFAHCTILWMCWKLGNTAHSAHPFGKSSDIPKLSQRIYPIPLLSLYSRCCITNGTFVVYIYRYGQIYCVCGTSLMACHVRTLSWLMTLSATLIKCWLSSWALVWLLLASAGGSAGTSAASDSSWMRDSMSAGCRPSCWVSSSAWTDTSSRVDAWAQLTGPDGCCPSATWDWSHSNWIRSLYYTSCFQSEV